MRLALLGDAQSPHLLKWARHLAPHVELWVASSRGFDAGFDACVPPARRLALHTQPRAAGGNWQVLRHAPALARWLRQVRPQWVHAHYLTSHGTLAWLVTRFGGVRARIAGSAWGSDILVAPQRSRWLRAITRTVLRACDVSTSDSADMAQAMHALGALEVMVLPFGLDALPPRGTEMGREKDDTLFFSNRALEPVYRPLQVLACFAAIRRGWPQARLVMAHTGALEAEVREAVQQMGLAPHVQLCGRLDAATQAAWYDRARWYFSLPSSDALSVSVLEAMAHGCIPLLSDLPANRELVRQGDNGLLLPLQEPAAAPPLPAMQALLARGEDIARANRNWIEAHALFEPHVQAFLARLRAVDAMKAAVA